MPSTTTEVLVLDHADGPLVAGVRAAVSDWQDAVEVHQASVERVDPTAFGGVGIVFGAPDELARVIPRLPSLAWAQSTWAGVGPLIELAQRGYTLTALKGVFGQLMSEYVLGWLLAIERRVIERASHRCWQPDGEGSVAGKRMGVMGTGSIGGAIATSSAALGIEVIGLNSDGRPVTGFQRCFASADRLAFAQGLDYLVSVMPATRATDNMIDARLLEQLSPGAMVFNVGRGNAVVDKDLVDALDSQRLRAAVLDVFREEPLPGHHPFWHTPGVYVTSHTAAPTLAEAAVDVFIDNLRRFIAGEPLQHRVDFDRGY